MNATLKWKLVVGFVLAFLAGGATGAFFAASHRVICTTWRFTGIRWPSGCATESRPQLDLTPEQIEKIGPIFDQAASELQKIRAETGARVRQVIDGDRARPGTRTDTEQRKKLEQIEQESHAQRGLRGAELPRGHRGTEGRDEPWRLTTRCAPGSPKFARETKIDDRSRPNQHSCHEISSSFACWGPRLLFPSSSLPHRVLAEGSRPRKSNSDRTARKRSRYPATPEAPGRLDPTIPTSLRTIAIVLTVEQKMNWQPAGDHRQGIGAQRGTGRDVGWYRRHARARHAAGRFRNPASEDGRSAHHQDVLCARRQSTKRSSQKRASNSPRYTRRHVSLTIPGN